MNMIKNYLRFSALLVVTFAVNLPAQNLKPPLNQKPQRDFSRFDNVILDREKRIEQLTPVHYDFSSFEGNSEIGNVTAFIDGDSKHIIIENGFDYGDGTVAGTRWYFGDNEELLASRSMTRILQNDGNLLFSSETYFFENGRVAFSTIRKKDYAQGEQINPGAIAPTISGGEIDPTGAIADFYAEQSTLAKRLILGFAGFVDEMPEGVMPASISPNSEFVTRRIAADNGGGFRFELFNIRGGHLETIPGFVAPEGTESWFAWSDDSQRLVIGANSRWTTESATVFEVGLKGSSVRGMSDLYGAATNYAWMNLEKVNHPRTKQDKKLHGLLKVESISNEGLVNCSMQTMSNSLDPQEETISSKMSIRFSANGNVGPESFQLFGSNGQDTQTAATSPVAPPAPPMNNVAQTELAPDFFGFSKNNGGMIISDTTFDQETIAQFYGAPAYKVVPSLQEFEDGGEFPVFHVIQEGNDGPEALVTIVGSKDKRQITSVYSTSLEMGAHAPDADGYVHRIPMRSPLGDWFSEGSAEMYYEGISGDVVAMLPGTKNVKLRYTSTEGVPVDSPDDLPPYDLLKNWVLYSIEWSPLR